MNTNTIAPEGSVLLIDKPLRLTSFGVVKRVRYAFVKKTKKKRYKVGHAGTLDPLATGLLILCAGKKTKTISEIQGLKKEYTGVITIGATTPSYDLETDIDQTFDISNITPEQLHETAQSFIGENDQLPPVYSAKKIDGKRAYTYARSGEEVTMKTARITIYEFEITNIEYDKIYFRIACSKGTYIRSIAHDFGVKLGNGAHLSELRRTKIGNYSVDNALTIEQAQELIANSSLIPVIL